MDQLQAACTQAVTQSYADGVDPLAFVPPQMGADASPEEAAAARAAAEAATKIHANKQVRRSREWDSGRGEQESDTPAPACTVSHPLTPSYV